MGVAHYAFQEGFPISFEDLSPAERLLAEQAVLNLRSLSQACDYASDGKVLAIAEGMAVEQGGEFSCQTLQQAVDAHIAEVKKKFARPDVPVRNEEGSSRSKCTRTDDIRRKHSAVANLFEVFEVRRTPVFCG